MNHVTDAGVIAISGNPDLLRFLGTLGEKEGWALLTARIGGSGKVACSFQEAHFRHC